MYSQKPKLFLKLQRLTFLFCCFNSQSNSKTLLSELSSNDCVFPIRALGNVQLCPEFPFLGHLGKHAFELYDSFLPLVDGNALDDPHYIDDVDHNDDDDS